MTFSRGELRTSQTVGGRRTDFDGIDFDHGAITFVDDPIDQLDIIRVREDLVAGDDILLFRDAGSARKS